MNLYGLDFGLEASTKHRTSPKEKGSSLLVSFLSLFGLRKSVYKATLPYSSSSSFLSFSCLIFPLSSYIVG